MHPQSLGELDVSIPLQADFAILEENCFSFVLVPTFTESAEVIYGGAMFVC